MFRPAPSLTAAPVSWVAARKPLGLGADPAHRAVLPEEGQLAATGIRAKPSQGTFGLVADIGAFELSDNPDGGLPDSNPQGLLSTPLGQVIADADRSTYGILDVFPGSEGRQAHLDGPIAAALMDKADDLLSTPPDIKPIDVLAAKLPS
jgi:hypothetical protein